MKDKVFWKAAVKRGGQVIFSILLIAVLFFYFAGTLDLPRAWLFFGIYSLSPFVAAAVFWKYSRESMLAREDILLKGKMKWWDKVFVLFYILLGFVTPVVCGVDVRSQTAALGIGYYLVGILLLVAGAALLMWAMVENKFFEGTVRIQKERGHYVVTTGPYAIVRHPGYVATALMNVSIPLCLGSLYGLVPALLMVCVFVFRTHFEDEMLQKELRGYKDYCRKTKYRLVPFVW